MTTGKNLFDRLKMRRVPLFLAILCTTSTATAQVQFQDVTNQAFGYPFYTETWGASFGDYNGDGWPDIFVGNHRQRPSFLRNNGDGTYTDVILQVDRDRMWLANRFHDHHGAAFADVNGDGFDDLHVSTNGASDANFAASNGVIVRSQAGARNVSNDGAGWSVSFLDHNGDSRIDMARMSFNTTDLRTQNSSGVFNAGPSIGCVNNNYGQLADLTGDGALEFICAKEGDFPQRVYDISNGFPTNVSTNNGLVIGNTLDTVIGDFDGDLANEILGIRGAIFPNQAKLVSSSRGEALVDSAPGQGNARFTFSSTDDVSFTVYGRNVTPTPISVALGTSRNIFAGGIDNSGNLEVTSTNSGNWSVRLTANRWAAAYLVMETDGTLSNMEADVSSLRNVDYPILPRLLKKVGNSWVNQTAEFGFNQEEVCAGVAAADFDNDMDLDVYMVCRWGVENLANRLYLNDGSGVFTRVPGAAGAEGAIGVGLESGAGTSENVITADYDNNGFVDLFITNGMNDEPIRVGGPHQLIKNLGNSNNWISLDLRGTSSNAPAIGARVLATAGGTTQLREQNGGFHRWSQNHQRIHFGLGTNNTVDLLVEWPQSQSQLFTNVDVNKLYRLVEGQGLVELNPGAVADFPAPQTSDVCGTPLYLADIDRGVFIYKDSCTSNRWFVRATGGQPGAVFNGRVVEINSGNITNVSGFNLEGGTDVVATSSNQVDFTFSVSGAGVDGANFTLNGDACFVIDTPTDARLMVGPRHIPVSTSGINLRTLGACSVAGASVLSLADQEFSESVGNADVTVSLDSPAGSDVTFSFATIPSSGTATQGEDFYGAYVQTATIAAGQTSTTVPVTIVNDLTNNEGVETFQVRVFNVDGATVSDDVAQIAIIDDDTGTGTPTIDISPVTVDEGAGVATLTLTLSPTSNVPVTAIFATRASSATGETATPGLDFYGTSSVVTFPANGNTATVDVTIVDDTVSGEPNEFFTARVFAANGAIVGTGEAPVTIVDNDTGGPAPTLSIGDVTVNESDGTASMTITLSNAQSLQGTTVTLAAATGVGTATPGTDYYGRYDPAVAIVVPAGASTATATLDITVLDNDTGSEPTETLPVRIFNPSLPITIGDGSATLTIIDD